MRIQLRRYNYASRPRQAHSLKDRHSASGFAALRQLRKEDGNRVCTETAAGRPSANRSAAAARQTRGRGSHGGIARVGGWSRRGPSGLGDVAPHWEHVRVPGRGEHGIPVRFLERERRGNRRICSGFGLSIGSPKVARRLRCRSAVDGCAGGNGNLLDPRIVQRQRLRDRLSVRKDGAHRGLGLQGCGKCSQHGENCQAQHGEAHGGTDESILLNIGHGETCIGFPIFHQVSTANRFRILPG